ncbi:conserved hypothetical protein [Frankia canadensis]|uniref:DUF742 domain-containing protein n=1 Tax=Frankia canadensis TaxID=1836972 RepID=A0A2I2KVT7_9ACTN|nr:DUF742 domain-containing protein [Frankia canadensis]SNQ49772.1 conserved hypothetical protein [Frankia canadensis]SOU57062.1 conserved hypothetical protein [Frankia canadensis]
MVDPTDYLGPIRPYVLTGGQARPSRNTVRPETLLVANADASLPPSATRQHRSLVQLCRGMLSLAEAAAHLKIPVSVAAVMVSDLVDTGHLAVRTVGADPDTPNHELLERVLHGLRSL